MSLSDNLALRRAADQPMDFGLLRLEIASGRIGSSKA